jgi:hypothetical protein
MCQTCSQLGFSVPKEVTKKEAAAERQRGDEKKDEGWLISQESGLRGVGPAAQVVGCPLKLAVNEPSGKQGGPVRTWERSHRSSRIYSKLFTSRSAAMTAGQDIEDGLVEEGEETKRPPNVEADSLV